MLLGHSSLGTGPAVGSEKLSAIEKVEPKVGGKNKATRVFVPHSGMQIHLRVSWTQSPGP